MPELATTLPKEYTDKLYPELDALRKSLDDRIPEFGIQLQTVLGRLQELPEAAWALTDEQRRTIVDGFKRNMDVTIFSAGPKKVSAPRSRGPLSDDMV